MRMSHRRGVLDLRRARAHDPGEVPEAPAVGDRKRREPL